MKKEENNPLLNYISYLNSILELTDTQSVQSALVDKFLSSELLASSVVDSSLYDSEYGYSVQQQEDSSKGHDIKSQLWRHKELFISALLHADFSVENENEATDFVNHYLHGKHSDTFLLWLQDFSLDYMRDEQIMSKLLQLFMCFGYEELGIAAGMISEACIHNHSIIVQDFNLSLLGHWCNERALKIMEGVEEPTNPWMRVKYRKLYNIIQERCTISERLSV